MFRGFTKSGVFGQFAKKFSAKDIADLGFNMDLCGFPHEEEIVLEPQELNKHMEIPAKISQIKEEDIEKLSIYADKEANPLYPVPLLMDKNELKIIYHLVKE